MLLRHSFSFWHVGVLGDFPFSNLFRVKCIEKGKQENVVNIRHVYRNEHCILILICIFGPRHWDRRQIWCGGVENSTVQITSRMTILQYALPPPLAWKFESKSPKYAVLQSHHTRSRLCDSNRRHPSFRSPKRWWQFFRRCTPRN